MDFNEIENLVLLAKANDRNAKEELMVKFTPLILNLSKRSYVNSYEFSDIKNECYHTLFKCVNLYDLDKHRFVAYATNAIKNSINLLIRTSIRRNNSEGPEAFVLDGNLENTLFSDLQDFDFNLVNRTYINSLNSALNTLSLSEIELVKYVYFQKHSFKKYSCYTGIPYSIVITMKNEILYKLKKAMNMRLDNYRYN